MEHGNEIFAKVLDWLYANGKVENQKELSELTGIDKTTISRIVNNQVKRPSDETFRRLNAAFGGIFNPAYLRGESEVMLMENVGKSVDTPQPQPVPDYGTMVNAIIAANDTAICALKRESALKDDIIDSLKGQIRTNENYIKTLEQQVKDLKGADANGLSKYPFSVGAAEDVKRPKR